MRCFVTLAHMPASPRARGDDPVLVHEASHDDTGCKAPCDMRECRGPSHPCCYHPLIPADTRRSHACITFIPSSHPLHPLHGSFTVSQNRSFRGPANKPAFMLSTCYGCSDKSTTSFTSFSPYRHLPRDSSSYSSKETNDRGRKADPDAGMTML